VAFFSLLLWKGLGVPWYALGYFMLGGYRAARSFIYAQARPLVHPAQMGLAYGVVETFNSLSMSLAPLLAGILYTQSPVGVYPFSLALLGAVLIISIVFTPHQLVDEPAAANQSLEL
jgi:hypothetical protein